ncbi:hypothetical protein Nepgr_032920 [Nepenthes gracilis]|uniref:Uncharacterized protein n=1 Tax=Nepenthes gracilis TaxID=150966 RepID=A0AAD3Y660_NEPGR|nr:hypothetical protein Nepgr_032920 [Nepenthes gracilis]
MARVSAATAPANEQFTHEYADHEHRHHGRADGYVPAVKPPWLGYLLQLLLQTNNLLMSMPIMSIDIMMVMMSMAEAIVGGHRRQETMNVKVMMMSVEIFTVMIVGFIRAKLLRDRS